MSYQLLDTTIPEVWLPPGIIGHHDEAAEVSYTYYEPYQYVQIQMCRWSDMRASSRVCATQIAT
jgi:hypothetical protein